MKFKKGQMVMTWIDTNPLKISKIQDGKITVKVQGVPYELDARMCTPV